MKKSKRKTNGDKRSKKMKFTNQKTINQERKGKKVI